MESNWAVLLFIGKRWRFGAENRSSVSLFTPPRLCFRVSCQGVKEQSQTFFPVYLIVIVSMKEKGKRKRECVGMCESILFTLQICVHMLAERKEGHISLSSILILPPFCPLSTSLKLFIRHIIGEYKQRCGAFSSAAARLWSASLPIPRILSSNEGTNEQSLR